MSITSPVLLWLVAALAVIVPVALIALWGRGPRNVGDRLLRLVGVVLCQVLAVGAVGLYANNQYGFYTSWGEVVGESDAGGGAIDLTGLVPGDGSQGTVKTITVKVPGAKGPGAARLPVLVWLPKQYDELRNRLTRFPTVMVLPGQPSTPQATFNGFAFAAQATRAIDSGKVRPFIAVFPPLMIAPPRDTECTDVPGGPQAETWLASSVRQQVVKRFRSDPSGAKWSSLGFSTGGFCAAKLLLRNRTEFSAAVSIAGYFDAETDSTTGDLFGGNRQLRNENAPIWLIKQPPQRQTNLLIVASKTDTDSWKPGATYADTSQMVTQSAGIPGVATLLLAGGGHNYATYKPTLPQSLAWLGQVGAI
jgi:S-formylglutathione hydrolase FrmB